MPFVSYLDDDASVRDVMARRSDIYDLVADFTHGLLRGESPFSVAEREMIAAFVSGVNACNFCYGAHQAAVGAFGVDQAVMDRLVESVDDAPIDDRLKPVFRYVRKLTETPARMTQADADTVYAAGWDEDALHDAVAICALFNFYNRLVDGHGIAGQEKLFPMIGELLRDKGYASNRS